MIHRIGDLNIYYIGRMSIKLNHKYRREHLTIAILFKQVNMNNNIPINTSSVHSKYYYLEFNLQPVNYNVNKPQLDPAIRRWAVTTHESWKIFVLSQ